MQEFILPEDYLTKTISGTRNSGSFWKPQFTTVLMNKLVLIKDTLKWIEDIKFEGNSNPSVKTILKNCKNDKKIICFVPIEHEGISKVKAYVFDSAETLSEQENIISHNHPLDKQWYYVNNENELIKNFDHPEIEITNIGNKVHYVQKINTRIGDNPSLLFTATNQEVGRSSLQEQSEEEEEKEENNFVSCCNIV